MLTENERLACSVAQLSADNYELSERYKKIEKKLANAITNYFFNYSIANTEQFKDLKKTFFDMEWKELNDAENNLEEKKNKLTSIEE